MLRVGAVGERKAFLRGELMKFLVSEGTTPKTKQSPPRFAPRRAFGLDGQAAQPSRWAALLIFLCDWKFCMSGC